MNVLIVGGTRFVGLNITQRLAARGDKVTVANRGQTPAELPDNVQRLQVDISEEGALEKATEGMIFDATVHMIAMSAASANVVVEALEGKTGHYVQCGSVGVYAPLSYIPADENHPTHPRDVGPGKYVGFSHKLAADEEAQRLCAEYDIPLTILRPSAIIGAGMEPIDLWGARNPKCFQRIIDGKVLSIPNDGRALIQFAHVGDIADAFVLALDQPAQTGVFNISSDYAITLNYYVELLEEAIGRKAVVEYVPMDELLARYEVAGNIEFLCEHMCYTIKKARECLGYSPKVTPEEAVADSVRWMFNQGLIAR